MKPIAWTIDEGACLVGGAHAGAPLAALFPGLEEGSPMWKAVEAALGGVVAVENFQWQGVTWRISAWPDAVRRTVRGVCAPLVYAPADPRQHHEAVLSQARIARRLNHDINNLLSCIVNYAELAERQLAEPGPPPVTELRRIRSSALQIADQLAALRDVSVGRSRDRQAVAIHAWLRQEHPALQARFPRQEIVLDPGAEPEVTVPIQEEPLREALLAMLTNADAATPGGGRIAVRARTRLLDAVDLEGWPRSLPGRYLLLSVIDAGVGMAPEVMALAAEPFFTTDDTRRGMGLALVAGCAHLHQGTFRIESAPGAGTTVTIGLPLQAPPDQRVRHARPPSPPALQHASPSAAAGGAARVLLADDSPSLLRATRRVLARGSYEIIEANDGYEALRLFQEQPDRFDIVVLDADMPGDGIRTAEKIRQIRPELPILLVTGHPLPAGPWPVIEKPYNPNLLLERVRRLLSDAS